MRKITSPLNVKNLNLKNRIVLPPMATAKALEDGSMSEEILSYYDEKTRDGDLALVIVEHSFISEEGRANKKQISVASDDMVEGLKKLSALLHKNGTLGVMQINHAGLYAKPNDPFILPAGPSALPGQNIHVLGEEGIVQIIADFAQAARRCRDAGFDGVEIHSAHGYLLNQFYSPLINKRTDAYGGSLTNRIRLHMEIIQAVRKAVGSDYPVFLRLGACDYKEGGTTIEDSVYASRIFEKEGVDLLDISGGYCGYVHPTEKSQGYFREITEELKKAVDIPVLLTGGITDLDAADAILEKNQTDLIGIGRAIYKDSHWLHEALEKLKK
ncbi:NADH:flavin oxidoreductase [Proteiniclasticum sp. C24MP]|uniref:NADH:flavin oxidoreductase n=1 Tax=Proteiniclasticum sp. C24MP TaxID=3374101 RepID=UPI0037548A13